MYKTKWARMTDMLVWALGQGDQPFTLTAWGRGVGLKRSPYLSQLARTLQDWGVVNRLEKFQRTNGLWTTAYRLSERQPDWFDQVIEQLVEADYAQRGEW